MPLTHRTRKPLVSLFRALAVAPLPSALHEEYSEHVLPVRGQGTIAFSFAAGRPFRVVVNKDEQQSHGKPVLVLDVGVQMACFRSRNDESVSSIIACTDEHRALLEPGAVRQYWFSLDRQNRRLRFGKGELQAQLVVLEHELPAPDPGSADVYAFMAELRHIALVGVSRDTLLGHLIWPVPVTLSLPPSIVPPDRLTLDAIAKNEHTVSTSLPPACQVLYGKVAGAGIALDTPDFPDFSRAIEHSISTPGGLCQRRLAAKACQLGSYHPQQTYLRITIGPSQGDAPGSAYVLELWPGGHSSPIHAHARACAIIKVLHGDIWIELFPALDPELLDYYSEVILHPGDVTFLTPSLYQTHRLRNKNPPGRMTATLQCYRYADEDTQHYEYFDYIAPDGIRQFTPSSDWDYQTFKSLILDEWAARGSAPRFRAGP